LAPCRRKAAPVARDPARHVTQRITTRGQPVAITIYDQFVPVFSKMLTNLDNILTKAEADAETRKIDPSVFVNGRLAPDMLPLVRQVQIATDHTKGAASRLAGKEGPKWADEEKTLADLHARVAKALAYLKTFKPADFDGAETRAIELKFPGATFNFSGKDYLLNFAVPNFYFHYTTAYAILRHNGVPIGKGDFIGGR
jgi:uncharacterized protein